jgi:hypothetical protein
MALNKKACCPSSLACRVSLAWARLSRDCSGVNALGPDTAPGMRKSWFPFLQNENTMIEAERVNLIGTTLEDLTFRTQELRGYL